MKVFRRKKGKKYPEMVDTIHDDPKEDVEERDGEMSDDDQWEDNLDQEDQWDREDQWNQEDRWDREDQWSQEDRWNQENQWSQEDQWDQGFGDDLKAEPDASDERASKKFSIEENKSTAEEEENKESSPELPGGEEDLESEALEPESGEGVSEWGGEDFESEAFEPESGEGPSKWGKEDFESEAFEEKPDEGTAVSEWGKEDFESETSEPKSDEGTAASEWREEEKVPDSEIKPSKTKVPRPKKTRGRNSKKTEKEGEDASEMSSGAQRSDTEQPKMNPGDERDLARQARMKRRKRELRRIHILISVLILLFVGGIGALGYWLLGGQNIGIGLSFPQGIFGQSDGGTAVIGDNAAQNADGDRGEEAPAEEQANLSAQSETRQTEKVTEAPVSAVPASVIAQADLMAAQYDYDRAAELLKSQPNYSADTSLQQKVAEYEAAKAACVEIAPDTVSHVFVHSLIVDPARAFDGQDNQQGYNKNMVTLEEFKKIIQSMYDNGYVLVSLHDMGEIDANGKMQRKSIYLPEGKKPIIFSQDDVSYYHSYENDGFPDRLIVDENGDVKNEYTDASGNTTVGDYDMVPVLDTFIKEHPDFSYRGRKGIVVLTGYNGVLGYHTDGDYRDKLALQADQAKWLEEHPDFNFDEDVAAATKVADAMKANGWEFASHTWGHISVSDVSLERLQTDTQKWLDYVAPIVGNTDMIIFAFGSDIGDWTGYSSDNEKFNYLKSVGFDYFCNVDGSSLSWVQFGETYLRTGRMNIDGYRMSSNPDVLAPLFDVSQVYDYNNRPEMEAWSQ